MDIQLRRIQCMLLLCVLNNYFLSLSVADVDREVGATHDGGMATGLPQRVKGMH